MTILWTTEDFFAVLGVRTASGLSCTGVSIDTRTLQKGDLFVALRGTNGDGHDHVAEALEKGAAAALVHRAVSSDRRLVRVEDTLVALEELARHARARSTARVVAVTGSVGKTSTKEMLRTILFPSGAVHAAVASYNNHWGVPLTLARMPRDAAFAVLEIGMNHEGEIAPLARLVRPHVVVVTAIEKAHIGHLGSLEAIAAEKATIASGLMPDGVAVLPRASPFLPVLSAAVRDGRIVTFGEGPQAEARLLEAEADVEGTDVMARIGGNVVRFRLGAPGAHMVMNAVAALAAADALGADVASGAERLAEFRAMPGRGLKRVIRTQDGGTATLIDESYNGQPPSMHAALKVLGLHQGTRRIAVLGQMGELGDFAEDEHRALAEPLAEAADLVFLCGPLMRHLAEELAPDFLAAHTETAAALAPLVAAELRDGDVVLVKGSLATGMSAVVSMLTAGPG